MSAPAERLQPADDAFLVGVERRDQRCEYRRQHNQQHDRAKHQCHRIMPQPIKDRLPVAADLGRRRGLFLECLDRIGEGESVGHGRRSITALQPRRMRGSTSGLQQIDDQIYRDEDQRQAQDGSLQHRDVAVDDRLAQQKSAAGPGEHRLDQDRAAEQIAELQPHDRHHLRQRVFQHMPGHRPFRKALGAQSLDKILIANLGDRGARGARENADRDHRQGDHRQHQKLGVAPLQQVKPGRAIGAHAGRRQ